MNASIVCLIVAAVSATAMASQISTAGPCKGDSNAQEQRVFADPDGKHGWREYHTAKDAPELVLDSGEFARVSVGRDSTLLVRIEAPGEDFAAYTDYCFDSLGELIHIKFELRTAWGWGYREEGPILKGALSSQQSEFFNTRTNEHTTRPEQANDIPDALKPRIYLRKSKLPFFKLLYK